MTFTRCAFALAAKATNAFRVMFLCGILGIHACSPAEQPATTEAVSTDDAVTHDISLGRQLYEARCASCHEDGVERTPSRLILSANPPNFIFSSLSNGVMAPMAEGLSDEEKQAIALYISPLAERRGTAGDPDANAIWGPSSAQMPMDGPMCTDDMAELDLNQAQWNGWSINADNARYQPDPGFAVDEIPRLKVKWAFHYPGSKNGQATVIGNRLFVTSMSGAVYALDARTGCVYWRHDAEAATRSSVSIGPAAPDSGARYALYFSDWTKSAVALDAETGEQLWKTQIDDATGVQMTGSPTLYGDVLLVPISSGNEAFATNDNYECCKFIGSLVALNAHSGEILWKTYTTDQPNEPYRLNRLGQPMWGPGGGSIWSAPTVDSDRDIVYVATSNSHTDMPHDGSNSVIAIDLHSGEKLWVNQLLADDNYIIGCPAAANCPEVLGPDFALGASPVLHTLESGKKLLLAGQKSGHIYALDPDDNGRIVWEHRLSPGSALGGVEFGHAADNDNVYVGISDVVTRNGARPGMTAIRISDGEILWHTPSPQMPCRWQNRYCHGAISQAVTVVPGAVFAGAMNGHFRAYSTLDGSVIWDYNTAAEPHLSVLGREVYGGVMDAAGPTVLNGMVYVHSGYAGRQTANINDLSGRDGNVLFAFSVDGE
jgi:polyvinyl alcohol dehydrogenase (cytochrome)